ncbi:uroporphyrinogen-III synthase [Demequina pelophila]|uniref:uroporphyrinogen-III synthase n=1 Tax=Demequina pelophila TaxID=1638984 RepID=UPI000781D428|nr:uroporphyrinogen-III synthase [Demequina pelophila]
MTLAGRRLLVPVTAGRRFFADELAAEGAEVVAVEFIAIAGPSDPAPLDDAALAWTAGEYDWLAVTSRNAVLALDRAARAHGRSLADPRPVAGSADQPVAGPDPRPGVGPEPRPGARPEPRPVAGPDPRPAARVAAVGEATRRVCEELGLTVALTPGGRADARALVAAFPAGTGRVLAPLGGLASPVLARGLARKGWSVDAVEAYRTVDGPGPDRATVAAVAAGAFDAVLLTAGSVAARFAATCPSVGEGTRIVAMGRTTEAGARAAGLRVDAVAAAPHYGGIRAALDEALGEESP